MANNQYINKVVNGESGDVLIDLTADTITASSLMQGYTAHDKSGAPIVGTATGGGGGLEYETGTWTPASDVASYTIAFSKTHTVAPVFYIIFDATDTYSSTSNTNQYNVYINWHQLFGSAFYVSTTTIRYGCLYYVYRSTSTTSMTYTNQNITRPYTDSGNSSASYSRYWATETGILASTTSTSRYWKSGRTYKWLAVWKTAS